jgi:hypothetical protein
LGRLAGHTGTLLRAPIMAGDYRLRHPESVEQPDQVADEVRSVY